MLEMQMYDTDDNQRLPVQIKGDDWMIKGHLWFVCKRRQRSVLRYEIGNQALIECYVIGALTNYIHVVRRWELLLVMINSQMMRKIDFETPEFSAGCSRSEREFKPPRRIIYPVAKLLAIGVNVCEPADATPNDILQVTAVLI
jgi:hypothetical protein